jgi:hypothetical protein
MRCAHRKGLLRRAFHNKGQDMAAPRGKRTVTRIWLMAELNDRLKRQKAFSTQDCGARVRQILPVGNSPDSNWSAELFDGAGSEECRLQAQQVINEMRHKVDVVW